MSLHNPLEMVVLTREQYRKDIQEAIETGVFLALQRAQTAPTSEAWDMQRCCAELGIKETKLRALVAAGNIPFFKIGNRIRFRPSEIREWQGTDGQKSAGVKRMEAEMAEKRRGKNGRGK